MKQYIKKMLPSFICCCILLVFTITDKMPYSERIDMQNIGNILWMLLETYSVTGLVVAINQNKNDLSVHYLNNSFVISSVYILNGIIYENKIINLMDLFKGWHFLWSLWSIVLFLCVTHIIQNIISLSGKVIQSSLTGFNDVKDSVVDCIKNSDKGILALTILGVVIWGIVIKYTYANEEFNVGPFLSDCLMFWCSWFVICSFILFLKDFAGKIRGTINDIDVKKFILVVMAAILLCAATQVFPALFPIVGNLILVLVLLLLIIGLGIYIIEKAENKINVVNIKDVALVGTIFLVVTFILLPFMGTFMTEENNFREMFEVENIKEYMELIITGIEFVKTFL